MKFVFFHCSRCTDHRLSAAKIHRYNVCNLFSAIIINREITTHFLKFERSSIFVSLFRFNKKSFHSELLRAILMKFFSIHWTVCKNGLHAAMDLSFLGISSSVGKTGSWKSIKVWSIFFNLLNSRRKNEI